MREGGGGWGTYDGIDCAGDHTAHFDVSDAVIDANKRLLRRMLRFCSVGGAGGITSPATFERACLDVKDEEKGGNGYVVLKLGVELYVRQQRRL